jgi:hypothetical protein
MPNFNFKKLAKLSPKFESILSTTAQVSLLNKAILVKASASKGLGGLALDSKQTFTKLKSLVGLSKSSYIFFRRCALLPRSIPIPPFDKTFLQRDSLYAANILLFVNSPSLPYLASNTTCLGVNKLFKTRQSGNLNLVAGSVGVRSLAGFAFSDLIEKGLTEFITFTSGSRSFIQFYPFLARGNIPSGRVVFYKT